jgi:hypothetical protein
MLDLAISHSGYPLEFVSHDHAPVSISNCRVGEMSILWIERGFAVRVYELVLRVEIFPVPEQPDSVDHSSFASVAIESIVVVIVAPLVSIS